MILAKENIEGHFDLYLVEHDDADNIIKRTHRHSLRVEIKAIKCFFIVPEGSRFITKLGYRKRLFQKGYMYLEIIGLSKDTKTVMINVLMDTKNEN